MKTVREVSRLAGISVRTLHHYDRIGLLKPTETTEAGYRLYDTEALLRLRHILLLRELRFPLKEIKALLEHPEAQQRAALEEQLRRLQTRRAYLDGLIALTRDMIETGGDPMDFSAFDQEDLRAYAAEAKARWGRTEAYRESAARDGKRTDAEKEALAQGLMTHFVRLGALREGDPAAPEAQRLAGELKDYITDTYYPCTLEIFRSLGLMYTEDARFAANIDGAGGPGTAAFAGKVLAFYCDSAAK